jgi:hypothetical protein
MNILTSLRRKTVKNGHKFTNNVHNKNYKSLNKKYTATRMIHLTILSKIYKKWKKNMTNKQVLWIQFKNGIILMN